MNRPLKLAQVEVDMREHPWIKQQHRRLRNRWDLICPVLGDVGKGKSTAAIQMAYALDPTFIRVEDSQVEFPRLCYSTEHARRIAEKAPKYSAIVLDEAHEGAMAMEWQKKENREFTKFAVYCRKRHLALFVCIPDLNLLLKFLRTQRCNWIWWFEERGWAFCYHGEKGLWQNKMFRTFKHALKVPPLPPRVEAAYLEYAARMEREARAEDDDTGGATIAPAQARAAASMIAHILHQPTPDNDLIPHRVQAAASAVRLALEKHPAKPRRTRI